jgi:K+-sensing histidine kinase KdpD
MSDTSSKYQILAEMARSAAGGADYSHLAQRALEQACRLVSLKGAAALLFDENLEVTLQVMHTEDDTLKGTLLELEEDLFVGLRRKRKLVAAYLSFASDPPQHSFTLPLRLGDQIFGAIIGLQEGERTVIAEDAFLDAFSSLLSLQLAATGQAGGDKTADRELLDQERLAAVIEMAVTVNHEINNPLTAILGNVQLLLLKREDLDEELQGKLKTIEQSAMKIKDVTQRLMKLNSTRSTSYNGDTRMLDLPGDEGGGEEGTEGGSDFGTDYGNEEGDTEQ